MTRISESEIKKLVGQKISKNGSFLYGKVRGDCQGCVEVTLLLG